jgi:hypothetical protein
VSANTSPTLKLVIVVVSIVAGVGAFSRHSIHNYGTINLLGAAFLYESWNELCRWIEGVHKLNSTHNGAKVELRVLVGRLCV